MHKLYLILLAFTVFGNIGNCKADSEIVEGAIGIITTTDNYQFGDIITVLQEDKKQSSNIILTEEYQIFAVKCLSQDKVYYKVRQDNGKIGFIKKDNKKIQFETWEEHILNLFSVGFESKTNPLHRDPVLTSEKIVLDPDEFCHPYKIQGNWLQVKWGNEDNWNYGWIRWKENTKLLIEFFYFA